MIRRKSRKKTTRIRLCNKQTKKKCFLIENFSNLRSFFGLVVIVVVVGEALLFLYARIVFVLSLVDLFGIEIYVLIM